MNSDLSELEKIIGYRFRSRELLRLCLMHSSCGDEKTGTKGGNERLEFLGDAVQDAVVSTFLYERYPDKQEGELTRLRSAVVCEKSLAAVSRRFGLRDFLILGKDEDERGCRDLDSIIADAVEALVGAVFLDGGFEAAAKLCSFLLAQSMEEAAEAKFTKDNKTLLQEKYQALGITDIVYETVAESGPDHARIFEIAVNICGKEAGRGTGKSKKQAAQEAAGKALVTDHSYFTGKA